MEPFPSECSVYTDLWQIYGAVSPRTRKLRYKNQDVEVAIASLIIIISDSRMKFVSPIPETVDSVGSEVLIPGLGKVQGSTQLEVVTNILSHFGLLILLDKQVKKIELMYWLG